MKKYILFIVMMTSTLMVAQEDPYIWLEEVDSKDAIEFATEHSKKSLEVLQSHPQYKSIFDKSLEIYNSEERVVYPAIRGEFIYNFWQDDEHPRGIWRRTRRSYFLAGKPHWETLLDIDAISAEDDIKWVYKGVSGLYPDYNRFLISLSKGGGDATVIREFDVNTRSFIDDGFFIDESKGSATYIDKNTLLVSSDFGEGTMTTSGYPKQVKIWKRGTALSSAALIHDGATEDVGSWGYTVRDGENQYIVVTQRVSFFSGHTYVYYNDALIKLDIPNDANIHVVLKNQLILDLKSDWEVNGITAKQGTLVSLDVPKLLKGSHEITTIFRPDPLTSISGVSKTKNKLLVNLLHNVNSQLFIYSPGDNGWEREAVEAPDLGTISLSATDDQSDLFFFSYENFLTPTTLYMADAGENRVSPFQSLKGYFDASKFQVHQYNVASKDGTMIPYFVVSKNDLELNGKNPTLISAYGGFEVARQPVYSGVTGAAWLENGGTYVLANIRGGGEFGPAWHQAGLKEKRQNIFDDYYAVAEDLISRNITSSRHLGIAGGSNGGLLVGVAFTQRPDLYNAVVCAVPLLDMKRYNKLLAGASWMGEYGNPDIPEEWDYIKKYSPYQNLKPGEDYPEVFFFTSTRDDRVHPGHARKMVARMEDMGYNVYYYENTEGGHAGSSTNEQRAKLAALQYAYLLMKLS